MHAGHIIHLEDDTIFQKYLRDGLTDAGLPREKLVQVASLSEFDAVLRSRDFVIAILDGSFPLVPEGDESLNVHRAFDLIKKLQPNAQVYIWTNAGSLGNHLGERRTNGIFNKIGYSTKALIAKIQARMTASE